MAKNSLDDLNNLLYQTLENLVDPDVDNNNKPINEVSPDTAKSIVAVANTIISAKQLQLDAIKTIRNGSLDGFGNDLVKVKMLGDESL